MKLSQIEQINKLYFSVEDMAKALGINIASARVSASRYSSRGYILRLKRGMYILKSRWNNLDEKNIFKLANMLQVPSYISLITALSYHGVTTQLQQGYIGSVALKRTKSVEIEDVLFTYTRIDSSLYKGFSRTDGFFIASPEKAFLDAFYLSLFGKYAFDIFSVDRGKLDRNKLLSLAGDFPKKVKKEVKIWIS